MVHFWTLLFWYDFSLKELKYVSINLSQIHVQLITMDKMYLYLRNDKKSS